MEIPSVPDFYKPLSLRLCKVLDNIGASEDTRKWYMETAISAEILRSCVDKHKNVSWYIFGSRAEGTTTYGLFSDFDYLYCHEPSEVFQGMSNIPLQYAQEYRLIVRERSTRPGYCKLQMIKNRIPLTRSHVLKQEGFHFDFNDRLVDIAVHGELQFFAGTLHTAHGPAMTVPAIYNAYSFDIVGAYRCRSWPIDALEWLDRKRKYGWPSKDLIQKLKNVGFFVVKKGHPQSSERDLEWRISLSLQERLLMFSLNPTQFKCYILLKMVKKDEINKKLGVEAISSYLCKTCLFYMIENTRADLWQPKNLLACLQGCLKCIYRWVKVGNCPNYFIPEENMFQGRLDDELRIKLEKIFCVLLTADCGFLLGIQCDDVAQRMINSVLAMTATPDSDILVLQRLRRYIERVNIELESSATKVFCNVINSTTTEAIRKIFRCIYDLSHVIPITEHTIDQIRNAACIALPYLEISLISIIIANKVELGEAETVLDLLMSSKWQELSNRSDSYSAKLKQATFLCTVGQYEASEEVLTPLVKDGWSPIPCSCRQKMKNVTEEMKFISYDEFINSHFVTCIKFSWLEKKLIPTALAYEMLRSVHMPPASLGDNDHFIQPDWAMVDSKILLWFLMFLLSEAKGTQDTDTALIAMEQMLTVDPHVAYRETAMNLIGWCYKQEGNIGKAIEYFLRSLALVQSNNAAFWHLLFTVCEMISNNK